MKATPSTSDSQPAATTEPTPRASKPSAAPSEQAARPNGEGDLEEAIRQAAYTIYEARGRTDGHALEDWLAATAQVEQPGTALAPTGEPAQ